MGGINLTTLANVRAWVKSTTDTDNNLLNRLISEASRLVLNYVNRADFGLISITEEISGRGQRRLQLRNWPVIAVSSLNVGGQIVPQSLAPQNFGYFLEPVYGSTAGRPQNLGIRGGACAQGVMIGAFPDGGVTALRQPYGGIGSSGFPIGIGNISVGYSYGYCVQNEAQTASASSPPTITPNTPYGPWSGDNGVTNATTSAALVAVASSPAQGQYVAPTVTGDAPVGNYIFNAADAGLAVLINYNYVPYDIEQAVIEIVGERYRYMSRIGLESASLGGEETTSYMVHDQLTPSQMVRLNPYRIVWTGV